MSEPKEVSDCLKPWEIKESTTGIPASTGVALRSLLIALPCFGLGLFSFLAQYSATGMSFICRVLVGSGSNLCWGVILLFVIRWFTPEPYLRIAFYSFISPTALFAGYAALALLSSHNSV